ncbi:MAG: hypothetical protein M3Q49_07955, partial [Actinomycetota bacterium]|nr:hypothetical protein [Actinomycetota bacterium]
MFDAEVFAKMAFSLSVLDLSPVPSGSDAAQALKNTASIATMVLATSRVGGLTRKKEGFVPFQHPSADRAGVAASPV